ncbi:hypothetical protein ACPOL_5858 [Acidisarcina polymorpha]|uniref:Uncharacterized protein n=2 Tax=Acidisarcina polymorpha TaxID=2211140 RepID=A0A2Z5G773_9BACT|nr:hypothetical protein ACPOL_5858 [Acidisarcina polymorpha]
MWIFKVDAARLPSEPLTDEIDIESYQHYTNSPAAYVSPLSSRHP